MFEAVLLLGFLLLAAPTIYVGSIERTDRGSAEEF